MTRLIYSILMLVLAHNIHAQKNTNQVNDSFLFKSEVLSGGREIWVQVPEIEEKSLDNHQSIFPVLYVLDGEYNFLNTVGISQTLDRAGLMPKVIVVGISGLNREYDYSPTDIKVDYMKTGGGPNFLKFLSTELIPYINENYPSSNHNTIVGHSIGAMFALYSFLEETESVFNNYLVISPSLWWDKEALANEWKNRLEVLSFQENRQAFITMADEEKLGSEGKIMHNQYLQFKAVLRDHPNLNIAFLDLFEEDHISTVTLALHFGLKFLFQNWNLDHHYNTYDFSGLKESLQNLSQQYNFDVAPNYTQIVNMGRYYYDQREYDKAIEIYEFGLENFDEGLMLNGYLAQAYLKNNQREKAKTYFRKGLEMAISKQSPMVPWFEEQLKEF